jgi:hypothetical protein
VEVPSGDTSKRRAKIKETLPKLSPSHNEGLGQFPVSDVVQVVGNLRAHALFWRDNVQDQWALDVVEQGYAIEFASLPPLSTHIWWTSVGEDPIKVSVLENEVLELLRKKAIIQVDSASPGFYSTFFLVSKKGGGLCPVLNLKPLNKFVVYHKFRMETNPSILQHINQGDWLCSLDLKDAYFHVEIHPKHRPYLRFAFQGRCYQFLCLPFGLSSAPRVFTKILAPIVGLIHQEGIVFLPYLDDCLLVASDVQTLSSNVQVALDLLQRAGFNINWKKSFLQPSQTLQFLGMRIDTDQARISLPEDRASHLVQCARLFVAPRYLPARLFLRLLGLMVASLLVVPHARLRMRPIQMYFLSTWRASRHPLNMPVLVPHSLISHLEFWKTKSRLVGGVPMFPVPPQVTVTTDACNTGWGGHLGSLKVQGLWTSSQMALHINCLEMLAVLHTLRAFRQQIQGKSVLVKTDNIAVRQYINFSGGTGSAALCALSLRLLRWCMTWKISLIAEYVPGIQNTLADTLSRRILSQTEWRLKPSIVQSLFLALGEPVIDLFATAENTQLPVFCSWQNDQRALHVDALSFSWKNLTAYAFPPLALVQRVILKALNDQVHSLILIAPRWPNRTWFPLLLQHLFQDPILLPLLPNLLTQQTGRLWHPNPGVLSLAAWPLSGKLSLRQAYHRRLLTQFWLPGQLPPTNPMRVAGDILLPGVQRRVLIPLRLV